MEKTSVLQRENCTKDKCYSSLPCHWIFFQYFFYLLIIFVQWWCFHFMLLFFVWSIMNTTLIWLWSMKWYWIPEPGNWTCIVMVKPTCTKYNLPDLKNAIWAHWWRRNTICLIWRKLFVYIDDLDVVMHLWSVDHGDEVDSSDLITHCVCIWHLCKQQQSYPA